MTGEALTPLESGVQTFETQKLSLYFKFANNCYICLSLKLLFML